MLKYKELHKLIEDLTSIQSNQRPNCGNILNGEKHWQLTMDEIMNETEFQKIKKTTVDFKNLDDNFHVSFIKTKIRMNAIE
jgi:hypothetical protein